MPEKNAVATIRYIGPSHDYRTNRWEIICKCRKVFEPLTTMYASQQITCPKCNTLYFVDYNATPATIIEI